MAARCCQCASLGLCVRCSCVSSGVLCGNCYPSRKGRCANQSSQRCPDLESDVTVSSQSVSHVPLVMSSSSSSSPSVLQSSVSTSSSASDMSLPCFPSIGDPSFRWGEYDAVVVTESLETVYKEVVHWKPTLFKIPSGIVGKSFTSELSRLFLAFSSGSALESVALKAAFVMPILLLQQSNVKAKEKSNKLLLERRLKLWEEGEFIKLLEEGRSLQKHRKIYHRTGGHKNNSSLSRSFANMIFQGKMGAALQLLSDEGSSSLLHHNDIAVAGSGKTVMQILREKHPNGAAVDPGVILQPNAPFQLPHPVFDQIDASLIRSVVL